MENEKPLSFLDQLNESQTNVAFEIAEQAKKMGLNPRLAVAVAYAESRLNPAVNDSEKGAIGLMQVLPDTGKMLGFSEKDLRDPAKNREAGLMYLKQGYDKLKDPALTAAGYHAGYDHKFFENPDKNPFGPKTTQYVKDIQSYGGFTEPQAEEAATEEETGEDEGMRGPPAPPSELDFLMNKAKGVYEDASSVASEMTPTDYAKLAGTATGAYVAPKVAGALQSLQQAATNKPTGGEKWAQNWAGQNRPGASVPEAAAGYQRSKNQGKISGRVSQMYGPRAPVEPGVFKPGRLAMPKPPNAPPITPLAGKVADYGQAVMNSPLGKKVMGGLGGYGAATQGMEAYQQARQGDTPAATFSGLGSLGNVLTAIPQTRAIGAGLSVLSPAAQWMLQHSRKMSPEAAQDALQRTDPMGNPIP